MLKTDWLFGLALVALITPACTTKTSLGSEGDDGGRAAEGGRDTRPPGCTFEPVSLDLSCNDDPNIPTVEGSCDFDGTCTCRPGFVLNPTSKRCKLDPTSDAGAIICTVGADQTCNDDPLSAQIFGTCVDGVACACKTGYSMNLKTGRCKRPTLTDAGTVSPNDVVCTGMLDQTCNDDDTFSGTAGHCMKGFSCSCNDGFVLNPATGRCRAGSKPDAAVTPDSPGGQTCLWQDPGTVNRLKRFRFLLTTPDGQAQTPPRSVDAGAWPINDFQGRVVEKTGNQLTIDSCLTPATCQASLYRFVVCEGTACSAQSSPGNINVPISAGRRVRVVWHLDSDNAFCPGIFWLAIYDAEPGAGQGNLLFLGSGGRKPETTKSPRNYMADLPFSVAVEALPCGFPGISDAPGDFSFVFSPKNGSGTTVKLGTGENGSFEFAVAGSDLQRLQVHSLVAVQPEVSDSYWNWDFWMAADSTLTPVDAGSRDTAGVCTFGKNQTCNDESWASWVAGTCQSNGTCVCDGGFVLNPSSGRCAYVPKDAGPDATAGVCTPGLNQTCNDDPVSAAVMGVCQASGTCSCNSGYVLNTATGKCMRPATICSGNYLACGCGCCTGTTPQALCYYPSAGDSLSTVIAEDEAVKNDKAKCEMAGCSLGQRYLCCHEAAAEPAGSAEYSASFIAGGYDRISIKKTGNDGICMQLTLVSPVPTSSSGNPMRVSTPTRWAIEAPLFKSTCGSSGTSEQAIGAQGTVTYVPNGTSCALGAHVTVFFYSSASGSVSTARFDAEDIPVSGGVSSGYCQ